MLYAAPAQAKELNLVKQFRRLAARGALIPLTLVALVFASSIPANVAPLDPTSSASRSALTHYFGPLSMNW